MKVSIISRALYSLDKLNYYPREVLYAVSAVGGAAGGYSVKLHHPAGSSLDLTAVVVLMGLNALIGFEHTRMTSDQNTWNKSSIFSRIIHSSAADQVMNGSLLGCTGALAAYYFTK
jgi:hypothetical protein